MKELEECDYVVIASDCTNHNATKLLLILLRYCFLSDDGKILIKTATLNVHDVQDEKAVTVSSKMLESAAVYQVENKIYGFVANNAAVNFGALDSKTEGNVHAMLEAALKCQLIPIGCAAHIIHNALSAAVMNVIPIDIDTVLLKIVQHFHIYTQRMKKYREFCDFVGCEAKNILSHVLTRWLSVYPCVDRLLKIYNALQSYFLNESKVPLVLRNFFSNEHSYFWLLFLHPQLELFHNCLTAIQKQDLSAIEVVNHYIYITLINRMKDRLEQSHIPFTALQYLCTNVISLSKSQVQEVVRNYYSQLTNYMEKWKKCMINVEEMKLLTLDAEIDSTAFDELCENLIKDKISDNVLFDACTVLNNIVKEQLKDENWKLATLKERWETVYRDFKKNNIEFQFLKKITQIIFVVPSTNAEIERCFSLINRYWDDEKSRLSVPTVEAVLKVKNINKSCEEFFQIISNDSELLKNYRSSKKYV